MTSTRARRNDKIETAYREGGAGWLEAARILEQTRGRTEVIWMEEQRTAAQRESKEARETNAAEKPNGEKTETLRRGALDKAHVMGTLLSADPQNYRSGILHSLCAATLAVLRNTNPAQQQSLLGVEVMVKQDKVPGHNDAIYDTVPKEDQLLYVEFLEIAPTPIVADRVFFVYLHGYLPESKKKELALLDEGLVDATLSVSSSAVYPNGSYEDAESVIMPFKTTPFNDLAHLIIRDARGTQVDYIPSSGRSDILLDFHIPTMFLKSDGWLR
ncbi:uncharacterized protein N7482_000698 [Penicillium canariense]|uniref:Uncharacterized protein n=1 Tax=Penicillium canariense TaxID=189055 RepID=A0A9W9IIC5_9EURO|nr:uncharacterized protein N7482_000698 [Penicillium canariense]KAJ5174821.1 hypothetical protein N7482_000698 [Penicillium canariense]